MRVLSSLSLITSLLVSIAVEAATVPLEVQPAPPRDLPRNLIITPQSPLAALEDRYREVLTENGDDASAWHTLGTVLFHSDKKEEALEAWDKAHTLDPLFAPPEVMADVQLVFRLQRNGKPEQAAAQLENAEARHGENPYFQLILAEQAMRSRNNDKALEAYNKAAELDPGLFAPQLNLGKFYDFVGEREKALNAYLKATELAPKHALPWDFLGTHQFNSGDLQAAHLSFQSAEAVDPRQPLAEIRLAALSSSVGDRVGARWWYEKALERATSGQDAIRIALSDAQIRLGLLDEAERTIDIVLESNESAPVLVARAFIYEQRGDLDSAIQRYRKAVRIDPGNVVSANNLAMALIRAGQNPEEALAFAKYAYEKQPQNAAIYGTHALALANSGEHAEALPLLNNAVRITPEDEWLRYYLGRAFAEEGVNDLARMHLEAALILDPDFQKREEIMSILSDINAK